MAAGAAATTGIPERLGWWLLLLLGLTGPAATLAGYIEVNTFQALDHFRFGKVTISCVLGLFPGTRFLVQPSSKIFVELLKMELAPVNVPL
ncbi:hypothetical protein lerEdw1_004457 [Lerista edwardsae]|nr:hypothetical protein lerEdw1_004457 [Lerista edwardsae]